MTHDAYLDQTVYTTGCVPGNLTRKSSGSSQDALSPTVVQYLYDAQLQELLWSEAMSSCGFSQDTRRGELLCQQSGDPRWVRGTELDLIVKGWASTAGRRKSRPRKPRLASFMLPCGELFISFQLQCEEPGSLESWSHLAHAFPDAITR